MWCLLLCGWGSNAKWDSVNNQASKGDKTLYNNHACTYTCITFMVECAFQMPYSTILYSKHYYAITMHHTITHQILKQRKSDCFFKSKEGLCDKITKIIIFFFKANKFCALKISQCHRLMLHYYYYHKDYPSSTLIAELLNEQRIIPIFANEKKVREVYD